MNFNIKEKFKGTFDTDVLKIIWYLYVVESNMYRLRSKKNYIPKRVKLIFV